MLRWIAGLLTIAVLVGSYLSYQQHNDLLEARGQLKAVQLVADEAIRAHESAERIAEIEHARANPAEAAARRAVVVAE